MKSSVSDASIAGLSVRRIRRNVLILDTDLLTIVQRRTGNAAELLLERLDSSSDPDVHVTIVSFEEQMRGWLAFISNARSAEAQVNGYHRLHALLDDFNDRPVLDFDGAAAAIFLSLRKQKVRVGTMDLRVAAITLAHGATLLSRNLADFRRVPGLKVADWTT